MVQRWYCSWRLSSYPESNQSVFKPMSMSKMADIAKIPSSAESLMVPCNRRYWQQMVLGIPSHLGIDRVERSLGSSAHFPTIAPTLFSSWSSLSASNSARSACQVSFHRVRWRPLSQSGHSSTDCISNASDSHVDLLASPFLPSLSSHLYGRPCYASPPRALGRAPRCVPQASLFPPYDPARGWAAAPPAWCNSRLSYAAIPLLLSERSTFQRPNWPNFEFSSPWADALSWIKMRYSTVPPSVLPSGRHSLETSFVHDESARRQTVWRGMNWCDRSGFGDECDDSRRHRQCQLADSYSI